MAALLAERGAPSVTACSSRVLRSLHSMAKNILREAPVR